jgi:hypothetical protein
MRRLALVTVAAICIFCLPSALIAQSTPPLTPFRGLVDHISQTFWGGVPGGHSDGAVHAISGDGRYVVFSSGAWDLIPDDYNYLDDVFMRDRMLGTTSRVSVASNGAESNGFSQYPAISTNGRHIAFASGATNLVGDDTNGHWDIFVRDLDSNQTVRISLATAGTQGDADSYLPSISADGRYVSFISGATTFAPGTVQYGPMQVYIHDRDADGNGIFDEMGSTTTDLVSVGVSGGPADQYCLRPRVSTDGRYVLFESTAANLHPVGNLNGQNHLYLRDRQEAQTILIDRAVTGGPSAWGITWQGSDMSDDGRFITYTSVSQDIVPFDMNWQSQVFLYDAAADPIARTTVVSRLADGTLAAGSSYYTAVSGDGRYVAFMTDATNLAEPGPIPGNFSLIVRDNQDGSFRRVDVLEGDVPFDGQYTFNPSLSADGTAIAFQSNAQNAIDGYYAWGSHHIFVVTAFSSSPESASYPQDGGAGAIDVNTTEVSGWNASTWDNWIVLMDGGGFGAGPRTVQYLVSPNTTGIVRDGHIRVGSKFVTIHQEGDGDTTPPVITPIITGTLGPDGWYVSDIVVQWTISDPESEIVNIGYGCSTATFTSDFIYASPTCEATSHGGTASVLVPLKRDTTPPVISITTPAPSIYLAFNYIPAAFSCNDNYLYSGVDTCVITQGSDPLDMTPGRHVFEVTATDRAGNSTTKTVEYIAGPEVCTTLPLAPANLKGWWKFDGNLRDSIMGRDAIGNVGPGTFQYGVAGEGWDDAYSGNFLWAWEGSTTAAGQGLTVATWVRPRGQYGTFGTIVWNPLQYRIARYADGTLRWAFNTTTGFDWVNTGVQIPLNIWSHVAVTVKDGVVRSYLNGRLVHTAQLSGTLTTTGNPGENLNIGGRNGMMASLIGTLDDLMIFDDALAPEDVDNLALYGHGSLCTPFTSNVELTAPPTIVYGTHFQVTVRLTDASGRPLPNRPLTITSDVTPGYVYSDVQTNANGSVTVQFPINSEMTVGDYADAIHATFGGDGAFAAADAHASVTLVGGTPTLNWSQPAPITYGTALGSAQLNATTNFPGTIVYSPPAGTVLDAGTHTLSVTLTPTDSAHWAPRTITTTLLVNKATPTVEISSAPLFYTGQPRQANVIVHGVGSAELNPFTVLYNGSAALPVNAGTYALLVNYAGSANYQAVSATGSLVINKATPIMPTIDDITGTYDGNPWGVAVNVAGVNNEWLTPVIVTYNGSTTTPINAGVYAIEARYDGSGNYNAVSRTATLTILKAAPYLTWTYPASITYGTPLGATQLNATSNIPGTFVYTPAVGTVLGAGTHTLTATFTPSDTANYQVASASRPISVSKANPQAVWYAPAAIVYGTALGAVQLNATAATSGTFVYSPAAGTVLDAGTHIVTVNFTPDDAANYNAGSASVLVTVTKASSAVTWNNPADIVYGTALGASQLNATASIAGTFAYVPAAGTVLAAGSHTLAVTFTPTDAANYNGATASVTLNVTKATSALTWSNPADIVYGTALGALQLNATANVPGTFAYSPAAGVVLGAGSATLSVTFTPTDANNYNGATASVTLNVAKAAAALTWSNPADIVYGTALSAVQLNATANVPGTFAYSPAAGTVLGAGSATLSVTFTPTDANNYNGATASVTLNVAKAASAITWSNPADIVYGTAIGATQLNATANVAGAFVYSPAEGTLLNAGTQTLSVTFTPADSGNYNGATASVTINVGKAASAITWSNPANVIYGTALGAEQLNATANIAGTFAYSPAAGTLLNGGTQTLSVTFTPADSGNYDGATASVTINVGKAASAITWSISASIIYGTALGAEQLNATANVAGTFAYSPAAGTVLNAGTQTLSVTFTPADAGNYESATASITLNVAKAASTVSWPAPADVVYGTALGAVQLNATANVAGTFAYSPAAGTVLNAGTQTLSVTFTPTDSGNYNGSNASVTITIGKAATSITWAAPAPIVYGTALGAAQLNATASVPGTFAYSPAAGAVLNAGPQTLMVTFTPADSANYNGSTASRSLTVTPASLTVRANDASKVFGAPLPAFSATGIGFVNGDSMSSLAGSLTVSTSATASSPVGSYAITPSGVTSANYAITFVNGTLTIARASTATSVAASPNPDGLNQPVTLTAAVSVVAPGAGSPGGIVQFFDGSTLLGSAALAVGAASLTTNGFSAGNHTISATYAGDGSFVASSGTGALTVKTSAASSTTAVTSSDSSATVGQSVTLTATVTAPSGLSGSVQFYDGATLVGTIALSGTTARLTTNSLAQGGHAITARYLGNATIPPSTSPSFAQHVEPAGANTRASTTALTASPSPAALGSTVTLTATVTGSQSRAPGGVVLFMLNGLVIGQGTLTETGSITAAVSFAASSLPHGTHRVEAVYLGDVKYRASRTSISLVVN